MKKSKIIINKMFIVFAILFVCIVMFNSIFAATDPTLVTKLNTAFKKIQGYLVKLSTPIAGLAIATGVLMRKLSFGNEEKMIMGKKVIVNAIVGYAIIMSIDLIIKFVEALT